MSVSKGQKVNKPSYKSQMELVLDWMFVEKKSCEALLNMAVSDDYKACLRNQLQSLSDLAAALSKKE